MMLPEVQRLLMPLTKAINGITDENALNWFNHGGLFLEPIR
jgi:hypothetical protein